MKLPLLVALCIAAPGTMAQFPERAPTSAAVLIGIDTTHAYDLDSVCEAPRHWTLRRAFRQLTGTAIDRDSSGRLIELHQYIGGIPHGRWYSFDTAGMVTSIAVYDTSSTTGPFISYYASGAKHQVGLLCRPGEAFSRIFVSRATGTHRTFYEGGTIERLEFLEGNTHTERHWYPNGRLAKLWLDSAGLVLQKKWCPNGRLVEDITYTRDSKSESDMRGRTVLAHMRSGETFNLRATRRRFILKSDWDGERIVLRTRQALIRVLNERSLEEVVWDAECQPRPSHHQRNEDR